MSVVRLLFGSGSFGGGFEDDELFGGGKLSECFGSGGVGGVGGDLSGWGGKRSRGHDDWVERGGEVR